MVYFGASLVVARLRVRAVWPSLLAVPRLWALARDPVPSRIISCVGDVCLLYTSPSPRDRG